MIEFADTLVRGAASGALALLSLRFAGMRPFGQRAALCAALPVVLFLYVVGSSPHAPDWGPLARFAFNEAPVFNPLLLWLAGLAIFDDEFRLRAWHAAPAALIAAPWAYEPFANVRTVTVVLLYCHLLWIAQVTARGDLVETRIAFRPFFFAAAALTGLAITFAELARFAPPSPELAFAQAAALATLAGGFVFWTHAFAPDLLTTAARAAPKGGVGDPLLERLQTAMAEEVWRTEGLTIGALATALDAPEHQLRKLINQRLGHRNFAAFINAARVEAAAAALADPAQARKQITAIAYESGFASLGPFNRAFRAAKGVSPGEWRDAARRN